MVSAVVSESISEIDALQSSIEYRVNCGDVKSAGSANYSTLTPQHEGEGEASPRDKHENTHPPPVQLPVHLACVDAAGGRHAQSYGSVLESGVSRCHT